MKEKDYVTHDVALVLKEKGYNISGKSYYRADSKRVFESKWFIHNDKTYGSYVECVAPTLYEAQQWLREECNLSVEPYTNASGYCWQICKAHKDCTCGTWVDDYTKHYDDKRMNDGGSYDTYEEALNEGIREALKFIKNNKNRTIIQKGDKSLYIENNNGTIVI